MIEQLLSAFDRADADDDVRVVVVTGRGRAFCSGADLSSGESTFDRLRNGGLEDPPDRIGRLALRIFRSVKPVIAAINGHAVGAGLTLTLPMDIRIVSADAKLGFVFTRRGINPEGCSTWFLPRMVGMDVAIDWMCSGRLFDAQEALRCRLVSQVRSSDDVLEEALRVAAMLTVDSAPVAASTTVRLLRAMVTQPTPFSAHVRESMALARLGSSPDAREGTRAFLEKRGADFPGQVSRDSPAVFDEAMPEWAKETMS